jgi:hypothetical protein
MLRDATLQTGRRYGNCGFVGTDPRTQVERVYQYLRYGE